jgi:uncharacterized protein (DUF2336 family)
MLGVEREIMVQFAEEQSWTARAKVIERVATLYVDGLLAPAERRTAHDLFRLALLDAEPLLRRVLAESIKRASDLPPDIVSFLIQDAAAVSAPFLAASPLIAEDDLLTIAISGGAAQREAIAGRCSLSDRVAEALFGQRKVA